MAFDVALFGDCVESHAARPHEVRHGAVRAARRRVVEVAADARRAAALQVTHLTGAEVPGGAAQRRVAFHRKLKKDSISENGMIKQIK